MKLLTEAQGEFKKLTAKKLAEVLGDEAFGTFVILEQNDETYLQAAVAWEASEACERFLAEQGSDPWLLEYREAGIQYQAQGWRTLNEVTAGFQAYLQGDDAWRKSFDWQVVTLEQA